MSIDSTTKMTTKPAAVSSSSRSSLRRFLSLGALLPVFGAVCLTASAGSGSFHEVSKKLNTGFISCRIEYSGLSSTILTRAKVDGQRAGKAIKRTVSDGETGRFRFYGPFRNPSGGD